MESSGIEVGKEIALRSARNELIAVMMVEEAFEWDLDSEARHVCGTTDVRHPLVAEMHRWGKLNISGQLQVLQLPRHCDFRELRLTAAQVRHRLEELGIANPKSQIRNPMAHTAAEMGVPRCGAEEQRSKGAEVNLLCTPALMLPCSEGWEKLYAERVAMAYGKRYGMKVRIARFENCYGPEGTHSLHSRNFSSGGCVDERANKRYI